jgi:hypothetical protein
MQVPGKRPFDTSFGLLRDRFNSKKYTSNAVTEQLVMSLSNDVDGRTLRNSIITKTLISIEARRNFYQLHAP